MGNTNNKPTNNSSIHPYAPTTPYPAYTPPKKKNLLDRLDDRLEEIGKKYKRKRRPCVGSSKFKYETYDHKRKRKRKEKAELVGAMAEAGGNLVQVAADSSGGATGGDGGGGGGGGGGGSSGCGGGGGGGS